MEILIVEYKVIDNEGVIDLISFIPIIKEKSLVAQLLKYRVKLFSSMSSIQKITVRTSQVAYRFYEKQGFTLNEVVKDYCADGLDMYSIMEYAQ